MTGKQILDTLAEKVSKIPDRPDGFVSRDEILNAISDASADIEQYEYEERMGEDL